MAGRAKVGGDVMPVRFADGVLVRIDAVAGKGKRAEFIREAVERALGGGSEPLGYPARTTMADAVEAVLDPGFREGLQRIGDVLAGGNPIVTPAVSISANRERLERDKVEAAKVQRTMTAAEREAADLRSDKMQTLLAALRGRAMTARDAAALLGWSELLVAKVADKLVAAGLVHFPRGAGVMEAK